MSYYDYLYKTFIVGDPEVDGIGLMRRINPDFNEDTLMTIGVAFNLKLVKVEGIIIMLQVWFMSPKERFSINRHQYYLGVANCIYLFDTSNRASFEHLTNWHEEVTEACGQTISVIAADNSDSDKRVISHEEIEALAPKICFPYRPESSTIEISIKNNSGIDQLFTNLCLNCVIQKGLRPRVRA